MITLKLIWRNWRQFYEKRNDLFDYRCWIKRIITFFCTYLRLPANMLLLREMSDKFIVSVLWWCIVRGDEEEQKVLINAALNLDDTTSYNSGLAVALK